MRRVGIAIALAISSVAVLWAPAAVSASADTGFAVPFSGPARYEQQAPTLATDPGQINAPLGQQRADAIAAAIGLDKNKVLTDAQFRAFITGGGRKGDKASAALADRCVQIFTNTTGNPLRSLVDGVPTQTVLGSYGLFVDADGKLMSLANRIAPTRIANRLLVPTGYITRWFLLNGAAPSLIQLYRSAYLAEALLRKPGATDFGCVATRHQHQGRRDHDGRDVDGALPLADELRAALHAEAGDRRADAGLLDPDSAGAGYRHPGDQDRLGSVRAVRVGLPFVALTAPVSGPPSGLWDFGPFLAADRPDPARGARFRSSACRNDS